ncbi:A/G-specific adenine glycosylase [Tenacibaculum sp. M341]|uniref:A/G-specific adenine glycosylase n=1 Tax=Tenacibaculum sp. M341 TaxID=2530339 RepID=UPI001046D80F|nr:A/G-specific adenine glycosylase [Tenacibaculum sp. M341]TCI85918.1 A/G-specific adenine glycosylase [Tenacibaculum sp. M341]
MNFKETLIYWYAQNKRELPWRKTQNPYHIWLSEIMLQQTRVQQGLPYFLKFTEAFPTLFDLANAEESYVLKLWQGLGYYSRARNLHFTAKYIANELNGVFPDSYKGLLKLKGVGDYTASAIASICFNEASAVVDGNVYRVLSRYYGIETPINSTQGIKNFKELAQSLIDVDNPGTFNQAIMDFGATQCKPQNPDCNICPFVNSCVAHEKDLIQSLPVKTKKIKVKKRYFNYLVVELDNDTTVLEERTEKGIWQNLYQFPLIESSKIIDEEALVKEELFQSLFKKEVSIKLFNHESIVHKLSHQHLYTRFWIVKTSEVNQSTISWSKVEEFPVSILIHKFLENYKNSEN